VSGKAPRRGLVLGAGGVLGATWTLGALHALATVDGFEASSAEVMVGTSAGSVLAALLGAGVGVDELLRHQGGLPVTTGPLAGHSYDYDRATGGATPGRPRPGIGSSRLLLQSMRSPRSIPPLAAMSALLPSGRKSLWSVPALVEAVTPQGEWSPHPAVWIVAMDYDSGRRVAFGRPGAPSASLAEAVHASCSIPGWFAPVPIGGRRYVDGGTCSPTSVDLLAGAAVDEVYVLAPMISFDYDRPAGFGARAERAFRRTMTRRMLGEAAKVRRAGISVTMLGPGREDLEAIGANLMDPSRREAVLETSLRTSAEALRRARADEMSWI
jgi:NTE family protein